MGLIHVHAHFHNCVPKWISQVLLGRNRTVCHTDLLTDIHNRKASKIHIKEGFFSCRTHCGNATGENVCSQNSWIRETNRSPPPALWHLYLVSSRLFVCLSEKLRPNMTLAQKRCYYRNQIRRKALWSFLSMIQTSQSSNCSSVF